MKPARSPHSTGCLRTFAHSSSTVAVTSGAVSTVETTSTSRIAGAGLKKCMPTTSCGRRVAEAQATTGSEEVVVASTAPGFTIASSAVNSSRFTPRSSATASTTRSTSASSPYCPTGVTRPRAASRCSSVSRPFATERSSDFASCALARSAFSRLRAASSTGYPALANTSTMPVAMVPEPQTPMLRTSRPGTPGRAAPAVVSTALDEPGAS